jgi:hypothetical protein
MPIISHDQVQDVELRGAQHLEGVEVFVHGCGPLDALAGGREGDRSGARILQELRGAHDHDSPWAMPV